MNLVMGGSFFGNNTTILVGVQGSPFGSLQGTGFPILSVSGLNNPRRLL